MPWLTLLLAGCPGPDPDDSSRYPDFDPSVCEDVDGDLDTLTAPGCAAAGGVCVASPDQCADGTRAADHDAECAFDDGAGYCCVPPAPSSGDSCAASGGVCAPIAGCGFVHGWHTPADEACGDAYGVGTVCCAPTDACEGWGVATCCTTDGATAFVANCDRGTLTCEVGDTTLVCDQDCPAVGG